MKNILSEVKSSAVRTSPYPYLVVHDVLPKEIFDHLVRIFPSVETVVKGAQLGSNKRFDYTIQDMRSNPGIDPLWKEFLEVNASQEFFNDFLRLFGSDIETRYPALKQKFGSLSAIKNGIRYLDNHETHDLLFDAHISINTPVIEKPNSVRGSHVDDPKKLFGALFYMRPPEDTDSKGGELLIYKYKDKNQKKFYGQAIDEKYIEVVETVPYRANTLVLFLNTIDSLHGVTPRERTKHPRLFVNLVAEMKEPIFDIVSFQESPFKKRLRSWRNRLLQGSGKLG